MMTGIAFFLKKKNKTLNSTMTKEEKTGRILFIIIRSTCTLKALPLEVYSSKCPLGAQNK